MVILKITTCIAFIIFFVITEYIFEYKVCCTYAQGKKPTLTIIKNKNDLHPLILGPIFSGIIYFANMASLGQNDIPFLENFEGTVKIGNDTGPTEDDTVKIVNGTGPTLNDPILNIETVFKGLKFPTSMAFLGPDDILVLEKNQGTVRRIVNGNMLTEPLLDVNVANKAERGMLGIAISKHENLGGDNQTVYVFLYYSETKSEDGEDLKGGSVLGNRLYRYELENNKLINQKLLLDIPADKGAYHIGGAILIGPDNNVYVVTGDGGHFNQAQNIVDGKEPDGTSGILRITQDGKAAGEGILGNTYPLNLYYAYGIRNSFGIDFDPVTDNLWDTENGRDCCDEINQVEQGFNSGWEKVQGIWKLNQTRNRVGIFNETSNKELAIWNSTRGPEPLKLVGFDGKGKYSSPEFIWNNTIGPSAIKFLNSDKLGKHYRNDMFIGNVHEQNVYHFDLTENRRELSLNGTLINKIVETSKDEKGLVFGEGFGMITDIEVGPDGNLYILSHDSGSIFKISKSGN